jgi:hypothetical protein
VRKVFGGDGSDTTSAVQDWLRAGKDLELATVFLIGEPEDPEALWLTDWQSPLTWSLWGTFKNTVIKRGKVASQIGLEVQTLDVEWSPIPTDFIADIASTSQYRKVPLGRYDNWKFRSWTVYMPRPGDANTFGASELFGGWIGDTETAALSIKFKVSSFLNIVNQSVPGAVVEVTSTLATFAGATPPAGLTEVPTFSVIGAATDRSFSGDCLTPTADQVFAENVFRGGYAVFTTGALARMFAPILQNAQVPTTTHNNFVIGGILPWPPEVGDQFYVSAKAPTDSTDPAYNGFLYVPAPETGV